MFANVSQIASSGSVYEQLISQVIAVESQPKLKLRAEQTELGVYKGILSDFGSKASALDAVLERFRDPLQSPFEALSATAPSGSGFKATAADGATLGEHSVRVDQLARADARLSKRLDNAGTQIADLFVDPGDPGDLFTPATPDTIGERRFTINIAQDDADPVALEVAYTPPEGATDGDVVAGIAAAINDAAEAAQADGRLAEGTGVAASVVRETEGTSRLSLRGLATGYGNRLTFDDPDGLLAAFEVDRTAVRSGTGGGAVYAVGTGPEDSGLSATLTLDGLTVYRDTNTVDDLLDGVTLTLTAVSDEAAPLTVGPDTKTARREVESFVKAYNDLSKFLTAKSKVDPEAGTRGVFAGDAAVRGLQFGLRNDLARPVEGAGDLRGLADLGITVERDGTLTISDSAALDEVLQGSTAAVGALLGGAGGLAERLQARTEGLIGSGGTIASRKEGVDIRVDRIGDRIARWDARLARRETSLRDQFAQLEAFVTQAQQQQASIASLFFY